MSTKNSVAACTLVIFFAMGAVGLADKVRLVNGDTLTGTIKKLDKEVLYFDYFKQTLQIPWQEVAGVESESGLHLLLNDGQTLVGQVLPAPDGFNVVTSTVGTVTVTKEAIQTIRSPEEETAYLAEIARLRNPGLLDLWSGALDTGLSTSQGNAETTTLNVGFNAARSSPRDKITVFVRSLYSQSKAEGLSLTTANAVRGGFRYDVNVNERLFAFGLTELDYDKFQGLDLRFVPGGGFGFHWIKNDRTRFDLFGGGSLNREFYRDNVTRTSGEVILGEELFHQIIEAMHVEHKLSFFPNMTNTGEYRINVDNALVTRLTRWFSLQLSLSNQLNSDPIPGKKKNDLLFTTGLRFSFE